MPFAGNLRTLPLPDVFQTLNNIKATGVLRLKSNAGSRDVVFQQGEIIGVGFLDKEGREDLEMRLSLLGIDEAPGERLKGVTWYWTAMTARAQVPRQELDEIVHEQAREQLHNLFAWATADFAFDEAGPGKTIANELVGRSLERPLSIDTATILLEAAKQQDEWAELRARIRDEAGAVALGSSPDLSAIASRVTADAFDPPAEPEDSSYHLHINGEWRGPYPRQQIVGLVQTGEVSPDTWSYDPKTQDRKTLDQLLGSEARRITPDELESMRQAVKAAESRLAEELAGRAADLAELRGLASEILRLANDCQLTDPAITAVVQRLSEVVNGEDPSIVALAAETVVVAMVRHLRDVGEREVADARTRAEELGKRITAAEQERGVLEQHLAEAERRSEAERDAANVLRQRLAAAAEDAAHLNQELERARREHAHQQTARISNVRDSATVAKSEAEGAAARAADLERELGRMRADHARLLSEIANLQARLDEDRARHEAELEASRALASSMSGQAEPPTERHDKATERHDEPTGRHDQEDTERHEGDASSLQVEVERLRGLLADAEKRAGGADVLHALEERDRAAAERDAARGDTARLRRDLEAAKAEAQRNAELARVVSAPDARLATAESRIAAAEARAMEADRRVAEAEQAARSAAAELAEVRAALAAAEALQRERERAAGEAVQLNARLEARLRDLAQRLAAGEARLAELDGIADELAAARARAAELEAEAQRLKDELATARSATSGKLERARRRISELKQRLRETRRERATQTPWNLPLAAPMPQGDPRQAAPWQPQAPAMPPWPPTASWPPQTALQVPQTGQWQTPPTGPWPQPITAVQVSPAGMQPVPPAFVAGHPGWPVPVWPVAQAPQTPGDATSPTVRTTSGTFVPMPMAPPAREEPRAPQASPPPGDAPSGPGNLLRGPWAIVIALGLLVTLVAAWRAVTAVPVGEGVQVIGEQISAQAPIDGIITTKVAPGTWVKRGDVLAEVANHALDLGPEAALKQQKEDLERQLQADQAAQFSLQEEQKRLDALVAPVPSADPVEALRQLQIETQRQNERRQLAVALAAQGSAVRTTTAFLRQVDGQLAAESQRLARLRLQVIGAPEDGLVLSLAEQGSTVFQGKPVITLLNEKTLVINAVAPQAIADQTMAKVQFNGNTISAKVVTREAAGLRNLQLNANQVLMRTDRLETLKGMYGQQGGRVAFLTDGDPGMLGQFGLMLRGF